MAAPEVKLWALLDAAGVPFRRPLADWNRPAGRSLLPGFAPLVAQITPRDDPALPPARLVARGPRSGWLAGLLQGEGAVSRALADLLGPGRASRSSNARAMDWTLGLARLTLTRFPAPLPLLPGAPDLLVVEPGWLPPPPAAALANWRPIDPADPPFLGPDARLPRFSLWPAGAGPAPMPGYGIAGDGAFLLTCSHGLRHIPRDWLRGVVHLTRLPGRRAGGAELWLEIGSPGAGAQRLLLRRAAGGLMDEAERLAGAFDLPLTRQATPDI